VGINTRLRKNKGINGSSTERNWHTSLLNTGQNVQKKKEIDLEKLAGGGGGTNRVGKGTKGSNH